MKYEIDSENILKAHKEGCYDVKKVLENIAPDLFKRAMPYPKIVRNEDLFLLVTGDGANDGCYTGTVIRGNSIWSVGRTSDAWGKLYFADCKGIKEID